MHELDVKKVLKKIEGYYLKTAEWKGKAINKENMDILRNFDSFNAAKGLAAETRRNYLKTIKAVLAWATKKDKSPKEFTKQDLANFIAELGRDKNPNSMRVQRIDIKAFF